MNLRSSDEDERAAEDFAALRSGKLENGRAQVRFAWQSESLSLDLIAYSEILNGEEVRAPLDPCADTNIHLRVLTPLPRHDDRAFA